MENMTKRFIFDEDGNIKDVIEESAQVVDIREVYEDPYWKSKVPKSERKHKKPSKVEWTKGRIAIMIVAVLAILGSLYYIALQLVDKL